MSEENNNTNLPAPVRKKPYKDRATSAILAIFLGWCGVHKFYLGYASAGIVYMLITILSVFLIFSFFFSIIGVFTIYIPVVFSIVDAIIYLSKTDEEFQAIYVEGHHEWF